jgi:acyl-CoA synthetase (AMP-forming)/AMP-acid ligase II
VFGLIPGILTPLLSSGTIVLPSAFHAEQALATIQKEKITVHYGVPAMFILEVRHEHFGKTDFRSLRTGLMAGATCPPGLVKKIWTEMNCHVILSYGATETSGGVTFTDFRDDEKHRFQSAGAVVPGAKIKIVDEERSELPVNKVGELACSGQGIMKGYFQHPDDPALTSDGWYYTGDLAKVDDEGYLYIVGRKKDMIIRGGYNVYPWELEALYQAHPAVDEVSVIGLPDTVLGEVICAVIKLNADSKIKTKRLEERMKDFLKTKVASCKIPDHVLFIDRFPLNGSGKIDKRTLRETCTHALKGALR